MKSIIFIITLFSTTVLKAQVNQRTIGLRLGYDAQEVSCQQPVFEKDRLELTLGVNVFGLTLAGKPCRGLGLNAVYQIIPKQAIFGNGFSWYYGFGASVLSHGGLFGTGALAQIAVQYTSKSPFVYSIDYRPGLYYLPGAGNTIRLSWNAPCLAIRYVF